jgi:hypothetical protein
MYGVLLYRGLYTNEVFQKTTQFTTKTLHTEHS